VGKESLSERRACELVGLHRSVFRHVRVDNDGELKEAIRMIAMRRKRFGYRRICDILRKKQIVNHKKVYRLYREMELKFRRKVRKKRQQGDRVPMVVPAGPNERWSMDFVSDTLYDGRTFRSMST
jgi:putative transposase